MKRSEHEAIVLKHLCALSGANRQKAYEFVEYLAEAFGVITDEPFTPPFDARAHAAAVRAGTLDFRLPSEFDRPA